MKLVTQLALRWINWPKGCISASQHQEGFIMMNYPSLVKIADKIQWVLCDDVGTEVTKKQWEEERERLFFCTNIEQEADELMENKDDLALAFEKYGKYSNDQLSAMCLIMERNLSLVLTKPTKKSPVKKDITLEEIIFDYLNKHKSWPVCKGATTDKTVIYQNEDRHLLVGDYDTFEIFSIADTLANNFKIGNDYKFISQSDMVEYFKYRSQLEQPGE